MLRNTRATYICTIDDGETSRSRLSLPPSHESTRESTTRRWSGGAVPRCLLRDNLRLDTGGPRLPAGASEPQLTWSRDHHHLDPFLYFPLKVGHVGQQRRRLPPTFGHRSSSKLHRAQVRAVERTGLSGCVGWGGKVVDARSQGAPLWRSSVVARLHRGKRTGHAA